MATPLLFLDRATYSNSRRGATNGCVVAATISNKAAAYTQTGAHHSATPTRSAAEVGDTPPGTPGGNAILEARVDIQF